VKFVPQSLQNGQFKAKTQQKTDFGLYGSIILSRGGGIGTHWGDGMGGGKLIQLGR
jgi:hypothetical protein